MCPSLCTSLARDLPLCVPSSRAAMFPACTLPCPWCSPPISSQPILLSAGSWEDWGALHGVRSCQRLPRPGRCEQGRVGGPSLRFTLNPQNSPELEKCSIQSIGAADRRLCSGLGEVGRGPGREGEQGSAAPALRSPGLTQAAAAGSVPVPVGAGVQAILSLASTCTGSRGLWAFQNFSPGPGLFSKNGPKPGLHPQHQTNQSWERGGRRTRNPRSSSAM